MRQKRSQILAERSKMIKPIQTKIDRTEDLIDELENDLNKFNNEIIQATKKSDGNKIGDLSVKIAGSQNKIDVLFKDLEEFFDQLEIKKVYFEEKLDQLER